MSQMIEYILICQPTLRPAIAAMRAQDVWYNKKPWSSDRLTAVILMDTEGIIAGTK
jgi:hypothetical protein